MDEKMKIEDHEDFKQFVTLDEYVYKTISSVGNINPSDYTFDELQAAEKRVTAGMNKSIEKALATMRKLKKGGAVKKVREGLIEDKGLEGFGIDPAVFSKEQIDFIERKYKEFTSVYDVSTPYNKETVISMVKNRLKTADLESRMINVNDPKIIESVGKLNKEFRDMSTTLKILPSQNDNSKDRSKGRTSLAEIVLRYEARKKSQRKETSEKTQEMRELMSKERANSIDGNFELKE